MKAQNHQTSDAELVRLSKSGQLHAFAELVERTQGLARAVAYSTSGEIAGVDDLVQEALVTAWTRLHDLSDPSAFRPWLAGIVRNAARYARRHQHRHAPCAQHGMEFLAQVTCTAPSPLEQAERQQEWQHTSRALEQLPAKYREPIVLYYSLGESHAQVALALGLSEASARQRVHRARKKLAAEVAHIETVGRRLGTRASAAAGVLVVIREKEAWAACPMASAASVTPKFFIGLGALGGTALLACIAALVVLLNPESTATAYSSPKLGLTQNTSDLAPRHVQVRDAKPPIGKVSIGLGSMQDPEREKPQQAEQKTSDARTTHGRIKKHGPARLIAEEKKPLMMPDIDMSAVKRELWQ